MTSFSYFLKGVQSNDCCCSTKMTDKSQPECFEIVSNRKGKANIWEHFGFIKEPDKPLDKTRVGCKLCRMILKYCGNTTNLTDHVRRKHATYLQQPSTDSTLAESTKSDTPVIVTQCTHSSQQSLSTLFAAKLPHSSNRAKSISGVILQFIVKDLRPFSVVENAGFKNLLAVLEPRYKVPSRQHFSDKALSALHNQKKIEVKKDLAEASAVALTTDGWTSRATESYITITSCHIDKEWKMRSYVLQV